jgi:hypothetical protein
MTISNQLNTAKIATFFLLVCFLIEKLSRYVLRHLNQLKPVAHHIKRSKTVMKILLIVTSYENVEKDRPVLP